MTLSLSAAVKPTPAQTLTPPVQARSGHRKISANMQDLRLVHGPPPQASHQRMLPPGWGGAGKGPASCGQPEGEQHRLPHRAPGRGDPSTPSLPLSGPEGSRGTRRSAQEPDAFPCAAAPSGPDPTSQQAPKSPVRTHPPDPLPLRPQPRVLQPRAWPGPRPPSPGTPTPRPPAPRASAPPQPQRPRPGGGVTYPGEERGRRRGGLGGARLPLHVGTLRRRFREGSGVGPSRGGISEWGVGPTRVGPVIGWGRRGGGVCNEGGALVREGSAVAKGQARGRGL